MLYWCFSFCLTPLCIIGSSFVHLIRTAIFLNVAVCAFSQCCSSLSLSGFEYWVPLDYPTVAVLSLLLGLCGHLLSPLVSSGTCITVYFCPTV